MVSGVDLDVLKKLGNYPCAVCCKGVGNNSIQCSQCKVWFHKRGSVITGRLVADSNYICTRCNGESLPMDDRPTTQVDIGGINLQVKTTLCYLVNRLCSVGDCDIAITTRCYMAWWKLRKLLPSLTPRHLSPKMRSKVYTACVRSARLHGCETWEMNITGLLVGVQFVLDI